MALEDSIAPPAGAAARLLVRSRGKIQFVATRAIRYLRAAPRGVQVVTQGGDYSMRGSLRALAEILDADEFFRCHESAIVRLSEVVEAQHVRGGEYLLLLADGTRLPLGRAYRRAFEAAMLWGGRGASAPSTR